jgi:hypothetical protein
MANRTYLIQSNSPEPAEYDPDKDILAGGSYMVPVFWYALFDRQSIFDKMVDLDDGTKVPYPYLLTTTTMARSRFAERIDLLRLFLPKSVGSSIDHFLKLLEGVDASHLHLETIELWMIGEPEEFRPHVERCLNAFDPLEGTFVADLLKTPDWVELMDQAGIDPTDLGDIDPSLLTGYSWVRPVPWD